MVYMFESIVKLESSQPGVVDVQGRHGFESIVKLESSQPGLERASV